MVEVSNIAFASHLSRMLRSPYFTANYLTATNCKATPTSHDDGH